MGAPQIIMISLMGLAVLLEAWLHGQPKSGNYSGPSAIIRNVLLALLLWWGGFFG